MVIKILNISKKYQSKSVLENITFEIKGGEICGLLGVNGAGKSTLMKVITGLVNQSGGKVLVDDAPIKKSDVGYLIENPAFYDDLTGKDNLMILKILFPEIPNERVDEVLKIVGLKDKANIKYKKYSLGMKERLYLAYSIFTSPKILILDEPLNGLDPIAIRFVENFIVDYAKKGNIVFISGHIISEIENIANSLLIIDKGKIVYRNSDAKSIDMKKEFFDHVDLSGDVQ